MHNPKPLLYLKKKKKAEESTVRRHVIVIALTRKLHVYRHVSIFNDEYFKQQFLHVEIECTSRLIIYDYNRTTEQGLYLFNIINLFHRSFILINICSFQPKYHKLSHEHSGYAGKFNEA